MSLRSRASDPPSRGALHDSVEREEHPLLTRDVKGVTTTRLIGLVGKNTTYLPGNPDRQRVTPSDGVGWGSEGVSNGAVAPAQPCFLHSTVGAGKMLAGNL